MKRVLIFLVTPLVLYAVAGTAQRNTIEFLLEDQWGNSWSSQQLHGKTYVLIIADRDGALLSREWGEYLGRIFNGRLLILGCAHLKGVPFFVRWYVRMQFRNSSVQAPVLLDWDGQLCDTYRCRKGIPTLVIVDTDGKVAYHTTAEPSQQQYQNVRIECERIIGPMN